MTKALTWAGRIALHGFLWVATAFAIIPMLWIVVASLQPDDRLFQYPPQWIPQSLYLENFINVWTRTNLRFQMANSAVLAVTTAILVSFIGSLAAYTFARYRFRLHGVLLYSVLATQMIPGLTNIIPLYIFMQNVGLIDTRWALVITYTAINLPLGIWLLLGFFQSIPVEVEEAALMDGCTPMGTFLRIALPLVLPGLAAVSILTFVVAWNEFVIALTFISTSTLKTYQLGLYEFLTTDATVFSRYGNLHAAAVLGLIPTLIGYLFVQRYFITGITRGAIK